MFLSKTDIDSEIVSKCVFMCKYFHTSIEEASELFYTEQKRRTYVTPTSYLELIQTFTNLYHLKVESITLQRDRLGVSSVLFI